MVASLASTVGSRPSSRMAWLVMGPMLARSRGVEGTVRPSARREDRGEVLRGAGAGERDGIGWRCGEELPKCRGCAGGDDVAVGFGDSDLSARRCKGFGQQVAGFGGAHEQHGRPGGMGCESGRERLGDSVRGDEVGGLRNAGFGEGACGGGPDSGDTARMGRQVESAGARRKGADGVGRGEEQPVVGAERDQRGIERAEARRRREGDGGDFDGDSSVQAQQCGQRAGLAFGPGDEDAALLEGGGHCATTCAVWASASPWATEVNSLPVVMRSPKRSAKMRRHGGHEAGAAGEKDLVDVVGRKPRVVEEGVDGGGDLLQLGGDPMLEPGAGDGALEFERACLRAGEDEAGLRLAGERRLGALDGLVELVAEVLLDECLEGFEFCRLLRTLDAGGDKLEHVACAQEREMVPALEVGVDPGGQGEDRFAAGVREGRGAERGGDEVAYEACVEGVAGEGQAGGGEDFPFARRCLL